MSELEYRIMGDEPDSDVLNISFKLGKLQFFYGKWKDTEKWKDMKFNHGTWHFCNVDPEQQVYKYWYRLCIKHEFWEVRMLK